MRELPFLLALAVVLALVLKATLVQAFSIPSVTRISPYSFPAFASSSSASRPTSLSLLIALAASPLPRAGEATRGQTMEGAPGEI